MKKIFLPMLAVIVLASCKTTNQAQAQEQKYDFSNVQSISTDGMEPSISPNQIMKDTTSSRPKAGRQKFNTNTPLYNQ